MVSLEANPVRHPIVDFQSRRTSMNVRACGLPGEGLLDDVLTEVRGEEKAIEPVRSDGQEKANLCAT